MGRFFYVPLLILAAHGVAHVEDSWDLILSVDAAGNVAVDSQRPLQGDVPAPPSQPLREGLTYVELTDGAGRVLDGRALPLAPEIFYDHAAGDGRLQGGAVPVQKIQYHVRLPRRASSGQKVRFYQVRRRTLSHQTSFSAAPSVSTPRDFDLEPRGAAALNEAP